MIYDHADDSQRLDETATQYALRMLQEREQADLAKFSELQGASTLSQMPNRRCQIHNLLMEPLALVGPHAGYYCLPCDAVQLRPHAK